MSERVVGSEVEEEEEEEVAFVEAEVEERAVDAGEVPNSKEAAEESSMGEFASVDFDWGSIIGGETERGGEMVRDLRMGLRRGLRRGFLGGDPGGEEVLLCVEGEEEETLGGERNSCAGAMVAVIASGDVVRGGADLVLPRESTGSKSGESKSSAGEFVSVGGRFGENNRSTRFRSMRECGLLM